MKLRPRLLLTSVARPFGPRHGDAFSTTTQALYQLMWAQDIFRIEDPAYHWGLDVIAANIDVPTVVLHYPSLAELGRELRRGYDYVGISFNPPTFHKLRPMVPVIRRAAPHAKIVLGGYGTALRDEELAGCGDIICREDGIRFFRRLLGLPERPFRTPAFVFESSLFSLPLLGKTAPIFGGVGCHNGCDFCMTSHYFGRKHTRFLQSGDDLLGAIAEVQRHDPAVESFVVYDEDLLLNRERGRDFLAACRHSEARFALSVFGSVKALSQYEPQELAEMGISSVWIGFEGLAAGYEKQKGKSYAELFRDLRAVGISPAASMIVGFDYQTADIIEREFCELLRIKPAISQFLIWGPTRNTPLYQRMRAEGRLNDIEDRLYPAMDGFSLGFEHPHISAPTMQELVRRLYRGEYEQLGPTVYRSIEITLEGYRNLKHATAPRLRIRAQMQKEFLRHAQAAYRIGLHFAPNALVRARIERIFADVEAEIGPAPAFQRAQSWAVLPFGYWTKLKFSRGWLGQSPPRRHEYNMPPRRDLLGAPRALGAKLAAALLAPPRRG
ncbi:MAG: hypothetical protein HY744_16345 [Deltaproteobacteria bacterium]|nr:hypothetical protein [Deltaproteobacteria bacterium]